MPPPGERGMSRSEVSRLCASIDKRLNGFVSRALEGSIRMSSVHWTEFPTFQRKVGAVDGPVSGSTRPVRSCARAGASSRPALRRGVVPEARFGCRDGIPALRARGLTRPRLVADPRHGSQAAAPRRGSRRRIQRVRAARLPQHPLCERCGFARPDRAAGRDWLQSPQARAAADAHARYRARASDRSV